jgi:zinc transport system substrate-binding protein
VSIDPKAYFLERIGGPHVAVDGLDREGHSPHTYEPTPQQTAKLGHARAFFRDRRSAETGLLRKISKTHRNLLIVKTQKGVTYRTLEGHDHDHPGEQVYHRSADHRTPTPISG